jgi:hypothetical protein
MSALNIAVKHYKFVRLSPFLFSVGFEEKFLRSEEGNGKFVDY